jgi:hypothetical protein
VSVTLAASDLIVRGLPASLGGVLVLVLAFLAARAGLARVFGRFSRTVWTLSPETLQRTDPRMDAIYSLESIRGVRTKRTTSGAIREMRITFDDGRSLYVNAVDEIETLRSLLLESSPPAVLENEIREALDFDAPWFYALFGVALGIVMALVMRLALTSLDARLVYAACAIYCIGLGAYWMHAKPLAGRFGQASVVTDQVVGAVMVCLGLLGIAATALVGSA